MTIPGGYVAGDVLTAANMNLLPGAKMGRSTFGVSSQTGITTGPTDIASSSVTFTAVSGRLYKVTAWVPLLQNSSAALVSVFLNRGGSDVLYMFRGDMASGARNYATFTRIETGFSGSTTYKLRAGTTAGTLTIENATAEGYIVVEDIGPN